MLQLGNQLDMLCLDAILLSKFGWGHFTTLILNKFDLFNARLFCIFYYGITIKGKRSGKRSYCGAFGNNEIDGFMVLELKHITWFFPGQHNIWKTFKKLVFMILGIYLILELVRKCLTTSGDRLPWMALR